MANSTTVYKMQDGRRGVDVSLNKVLVLADCGIVQNCIADGLVLTLPATAAGLNYVVRNAGAPVTTGGPAGIGGGKSAKVSLSPNSADKISGMALTPADDKDLINTKATQRTGDEVQIVADGVDGWVVMRHKGVWEREA